MTVSYSLRLSFSSGLSCWSCE